MGSMTLIDRKMINIVLLTMMILIASAASISYAYSAEVVFPRCGVVYINLCKNSNFCTSPVSSYHRGETIYVCFSSENPCTIMVKLYTKAPGETTYVPVYGGFKTLTIGPQNMQCIPLFMVTSNVQPGEWQLRVDIESQNGGNIVTSPAITFTVESEASSSGLGLFSGGLLTWVIIGVVIAVVIAASVAVAISRSKRSSGKTTVTAPPPPPPPQYVTPPPQPTPQPAQPTPQPQQKTSEETKLGTVLYRLVLPNGVEIPVTEPVKVFGRETFERWGLPKEVLGFITREEKGGHFKIFMRGGKWYIEDCGSKNGTLLNGVEIKGKGPQELKDGDVISPGGVINIVFKLM